jgi:hypothetical protein
VKESKMATRMKRPSRWAEVEVMSFATRKMPRRLIEELKRAKGMLPRVSQEQLIAVALAYGLDSIRRVYLTGATTPTEAQAMFSQDFKKLFG